MDTNLDLFSEFLGLLALEKNTGLTLFTPPTLTEEQKERICRDAFDKILKAIMAPDDLFDLDFDQE